jgi:hypothetical protein
MNKLLSFLLGQAHNQYKKPIFRKLYGKFMYFLFICVRNSRFAFYKYAYGLNIGGFHGLTVPNCGKGKYVSVYSQGPAIRMVSETKPGLEVILIPYQPNHGVMVNILKNGKVHCCYHMDLEQFTKHGFCLNEGD